MHAPRFEQDRRSIATWLLVCCGFVLAMLVVGGLTRLTNSGLSMVEWKPVTGVIPPLNEQQWQAAFDQYKQYPEFKLVHFHFDLSDFKRIYAFEFSHRLLGRLTGLVFAVPLVIFFLRRSIPSPLAWRLNGLLLLGGLQGFVGWWMVKSGLADRPDVSALRLATHLGLALVLFTALLWNALTLLKPGAGAAPLPEHRGLARATGIIWIWTLGTALSGALVAGLDGGIGFNTFPLMNGYLIPPGLWLLDPFWKNIYENPVLAQLNHRFLALSLVAAVLALRYWARTLPLGPELRRALNALTAMALVQVSLGVATLLSVVWLPLAATHQLGALCLLGLGTWANHAARRPLAPEAAAGHATILARGPGSETCPLSPAASAPD